MGESFFFNVNGAIGRGAYATPEFPTAAAFRDHLDYLGIDRSLVWHVAARDLNPTIGNRRLLEEIAAAGLEERLFPAFVVTPACGFERGVLGFLREQLGTGRVRALRLTPEMSRFQIREIERLLCELAAYQPVVLWDCPASGAEQNLRDIETLAGLFPRLAFVVTQKMWPGFGSVLDLMWRRSNVFVDTSLLHMRATHALLVNNFGAERVLCSVGPKTDYGAAIAALAHAPLTEAQRTGMAHANIERLLKIPSLDHKLARPPALIESKKLWSLFRSGHPLKDVEIIDAHGHLGPHTRGWFIEQAAPEYAAPALVEQMDRLGVDRLLLSGAAALFGDNVAGTPDVEQWLQPYGDRFGGYLVFNPLYADEMTARLDEFFSSGFFVGFKILGAYWKRALTDPGFIPVWEYAERHRMPVLMHTWDDSYNAPSQLTGIAPKYPHAAFLLGHSGGGTAGRLEAEELALAHPNVYLEFCGSFTSQRPFETTLQRVGADRVLFGSDTDAHDQAWELGRYLSLPLPDAELLPGLAANIKRILAARI